VCALQLLARRDALRERAATRRKLLVDSQLLQQLYQDSDDLKTWINKKKKLADDDDYKVWNFVQPVNIHWQLAFQCPILCPHSAGLLSTVLNRMGRQRSFFI
jgi:hypothetical protein